MLYQGTFLACMFCFPILAPQKNMHVLPRAYVCIINEKAKGKFPGEHHVV